MVECRRLPSRGELEGESDEGACWPAVAGYSLAMKEISAGKVRVGRLLWGLPAALLFTASITAAGSYRAER